MAQELIRALSFLALSQDWSAANLPMIWITGARQVGKTFLVRKLPAAYYNWDTAEVRRAFSKDPYFFRKEDNLIIFDEINKRRDWKKLIKGYYDSPSRKENIIVTGSGRLDQYRKGGDSLQGRYFLYHLWPLTLDEIAATNIQRMVLAQPRDWKNWEPQPIAEDDSDLIKLGGFPAPFLSGKASFVRRWQDQYVDRLVREDTRDVSLVQKLDQLDLLVRILPERVGSPLSVLGISRDVETSPVAIKSWLRILEVLYLGFLVKPFHRKIQRVVKREVKWYFNQWTFVEDEGPRFENFLAVQLAAACSAWSEQGFGRWELFYLRDQHMREVDFLIARDLKPMAIIEAKNSPQDFPRSLTHYCKLLNIPGFLVYPKGQTKRIANVGWSLPSAKFLQGLMLTKKPD